MHEIDSLEVLDDHTVGQGGFLTVRRLRLKNRRANGSLSDAYSCDFIVRPKGIDAVVVAVYTRAGSGGLRVLLREGLRPPLKFGREHEVKPMPDSRPYLMFRELVAGIIEVQDEGEAGIRARAAIEVAEEAGFTVSADDVFMLGAGCFPSPGAHPERYWLTAVEIADPGRPAAARGRRLADGRGRAHLVDGARCGDRRVRRRRHRGLQDRADPTPAARAAGVAIGSGRTASRPRRHRPVARAPLARCRARGECR